MDAMSRTQAELLLLAALLGGAWLAVGPPLRQGPAAAAPRGFRGRLPDADVDGGLAERAAALRAHRAAPLPPNSIRRNPFSFSHPAVRSTPASAVQADEPAPVAPRPDIVLSGVAEDTAGGRTVRTAVFSVSGQVVLAKEGDRVLGRFVVSRIASDAVQLDDTQGGGVFSVVLK